MPHFLVSSVNYSLYLSDDNSTAIELSLRVVAYQYKFLNVSCVSDRRVLLCDTLIKYVVGDREQARPGATRRG